MGYSQRLWDSVSGAVQHYIPGRIKIHPMTRRHKNRLNGKARPQTVTHFFSLMIEVKAEGSSLTWRRLVREIGRFCAPYGRDIQEDTDIRGQTHSSWVGNPVPIDEGDFRSNLQLPKSFGHSWPFSEIQISRNIGDACFLHLAGQLHQFKFRKFQDCHDRANKTSPSVIIRISSCYGLDPP